MRGPEAEYAESDTPFDSHSQPAEPEPGASGKAFDLWGLRNSQPPVTPDSIGRTLDLGASWYDHLFCGFVKQSGSEGAEAWMHYVVAFLLLANDQYGILDDDDLEALEERSEGLGDFDGER